MEEESRLPPFHKETSDERLQFSRLPLNPCDISGIIQKSSRHSSPFWPSSPLIEMDVEGIQPGKEDMAASEMGLPSMLFPTTSQSSAGAVMGGAVSAGAGFGGVSGPEQTFRKESTTEMDDRPLVADLWPEDGNVVSLSPDLYIHAPSGRVLHSPMVEMFQGVISGTEMFSRESYHHIMAFLQDLAVLFETEDVEHVFPRRISTSELKSLVFRDGMYLLLFSPEALPRSKSRSLLPNLFRVFLQWETGTGWEDDRMLKLFGLGKLDETTSIENTPYLLCLGFLCQKNIRNQKIGAMKGKTRSPTGSPMSLA